MCWHAQNTNTRGNKTPYPIWIKFCSVVGIRDAITYSNFGDDRLSGLGMAGGVKYWHSPRTFVVVLTLQHSRTTACKHVMLEMRRKGSGTLSTKSPMVDEKEMRTGHWLGLLLCVSLNVLTLTFGWRERHPTSKYPVPLIPGVLSRNRRMGTGWQGFTCSSSSSSSSSSRR